MTDQAIIPLDDDNPEYEQELATTAEMYVRGRPVAEIASKLSAVRGATVTPKEVKNQIEVIKNRWLQSTLIDYNEAKSRELAKWDALETAYWEAWEESRQARTNEERLRESGNVVLSSGTIVPTERKFRKKTTLQTDGNATFLQGIERCITNRCKILGLFTPDTLRIDWRTEARAFGMLPEDAEALKETTIQVMMREITKGKTGDTGKKDIQDSDIIEGEFSP